MDNMFSACLKLEDIIVTGHQTFFTKVLTSANEMFSKTPLKKLSLPYFVHGKVKEIYGIFNSMNNLEILDVCGWSLKGVKFATYDESITLFAGDKNIKRVYAIGCNEYTRSSIKKQLEGAPATARITAYLTIK